MTSPQKIPTPSSTRWQLLRAGIQNVWEYDDQRFVFERGRLLLRGQNESGKTKALEVLLPFLLDASLQPHRLDPFGSAARPMRWNLLNDSNPDRNVAIGYVWLELGRLEDGVPAYWTLGAGLKARRAVPRVDDWYFATPQRVDVDLHLFDQGRIPLVKARLTAALGERGQLFEEGTDYRRALNERLFGLPVEQYSALVDALLQLRRPQLSKQLDPSELSRILSASLPPLDSGVIGSLAEGFERLDRHRTEREAYFATLTGLRSFLHVYQGYVGSFVKARAQEVTRAESAFHAARAELRTAEDQKVAAERHLQDLAAALERLENERLQVDQRVQALKSSDEYRAVQQLDEAEAQARTARRNATHLREGVDGLLRRQVRTKERVEEALHEAESERQGQLRASGKAASLAREAALEVPHSSLDVALTRTSPEAASDVLVTALRLRREALSTLEALANKLLEAERLVEQATFRLAQAEERWVAATEALAEAEAREVRTRETFLEDVGAWADACSELPVDATALLDLPVEEMRPSLEVAAKSVRKARDEEAAAAGLALEAVKRDHRDVVAQREALSAAKHRPPEAPDWRTPREETRAGAPFYLLCDFREGLESPKRGALEAALEASGILDAWVTPEGELLTPDTFDRTLRPQPREGSTLAEVLAPAEGSPVEPGVVEQVLRSVSLTPEGETGAGSAWVSTDGRFGVGPLTGAYRKVEAVFIGAGAREQARRRRLEELAHRISDLERSREAGEAALNSARARREKIDAELSAFPELAPLLRRQLESRAQADTCAMARASRATASGQVSRLEQER